ncbi:MAG: rhodanese-like domain-containing protein [Planctomycetes bacterium]|nr:rhodanese-like domain-containing protein [Planctomycetota bacterium]
MATEISVVDLARCIADGQAPFILDVREPAEFTGPLGHAPGALSIPMGQIPTRVAELDGVRGGTCYCICLSGGRSGMVAEYLSQQGFGTVINVTGGMKAWNAAGLPCVHE